MPDGQLTTLPAPTRTASESQAFGQLLADLNAAGAAAEAAAAPLDDALRRAILAPEAHMGIVSLNYDAAGTLATIGARWPDGEGAVFPGSGTTLFITRGASGAVTQVRGYHAPTDRTLVATVPYTNGRPGAPTFAFEGGDTGIVV